MNMNIGSVVQIGGAVKHSPLHSLLNFVHNDDDDDDDEDEEQQNSRAIKETEKSVIGGFIGEGYLAWRASGATIEVIDSQTCIQQAAWTFGAMLHYASPVITCVCGIGVGPVTHIVIGVDLGAEQNPQGMVGVLSLRRSRIIRAFRFQNKVTNVCMVTGGEKVVDPSTLTSELRSCQGLLAVATSHSSLYLVDLALDLGDEITSDEMSPAALIEINIPDPQMELKRNKIVSSHSHPILCLSDNMHLGKTFRLLGPDDHILYEAPSHSVNITSLMYIPQVASLVVGYSFGSFQLFNLNLITIDCASPYEENIAPVFSFAYQEPENDPRSFVYLWVCRSHSGSDTNCYSENYSLEKSTCYLYSMHYEKKEWIEGHGLWYQSLLSMAPRFNFSAIGGIGEKIYNSSPSKMISAMSIMGTTPSFSLLPSSLNGVTDDALSLSDEEADPVPELSLCLFCWEATVLSQGKVITQHYIAIFDINQWYQAQMPSQLRLEENKLCTYMSFHILDKVPSSFSETLLGAMPLRGSWARHSSRTHCEKMWYPSALSYDFNLLTSESLATYHCPSVQQSTISFLLQQGPGAIVNPNDAFKICVFSGILSNIDAVLNGGSSLVNEREHILNTALEYHLLPLLSQCVTEFSEGRFSHLGCSSELLLDWGWNKLKEVKNSIDSLCGSILSFPVEGIVSLSTQNLIILHQNLTYLSHLSSIFSQIRDNSGEITTLSAKELEGKVQIVNLLKLHLQIILWFYHCGLLPQYSPEEALEDHAVPFPTHSLHKIYEKRRKEIKDVTGSPVLLIDSIMGDCGKLLPEIWNIEKDKGHLYPPLSLHNILSMYLLPGIPAYTKHRIVQFLFLDLSSILSENFSNVLEELVKFPSSFSLSPSLIKLTQAFWLIDNKEFQAGLLVLLDPLVNPSDITLEQHRQIIKTFLYQSNESQALTYIQIRKPPICELEDIRLNLTVLLANGKIREAFHFQRKHRVMSNAQRLLHYFFLGCEELERLESIVHLPLTSDEEESFVSYLSSSSHSSAQDILLIYYIQKSRYTEITPFLGTCKNSVTQGCSIKQNTRSAIVQGYISHLPYVRAQHNAPSRERPPRKIYVKPKPLSAHIRQASSALKTPKSKSSFLSTFHIGPSSSKYSFTPYTPFRSKAQRRKAISSWNEGMGLLKNKESSVEARSEKTETVFPSFCRDGEPPNTLKASQVETPLTKIDRTQEITLLQESVSKLMENVLRKSLYLPESSMPENTNKASLGNLSISQDVISLLKTPIKHHNRVGSDLSFNSLTETPQSILKVRKILENSQALIINENSSPIISFPRYRMSMNKDSANKLDISRENNNLTPKQLRFDLSATHKLSVEEEETPTLMRSLQKKRKRSSPPLQSKSEVPSPRKPLPRFVDNEDGVELDFESECSNVQESNSSGNGICETTNLSKPVWISESNLQNDKENMLISSKSQESNEDSLTSKKVDAFEEFSQIKEDHDCTLNSLEGSLLEDSFHSVLDNQEVVMDLDQEKLPHVHQTKDAANKDEQKSCSSSDMFVRSIDKEVEGTSLVNYAVNTELKSLSKQKNSPVKNTEIHTSNITVTTTKLVKETYSASSQEKTSTIYSMESQSEPNNISESSNLSVVGEPFCNKYIERITETNRNYSEMSPSLELSVNKCHNEPYFEKDNSEPLKLNLVESINNLREVDEKAVEVCTKTEENNIDKLSISEENVFIDSDKNKSLDENYILKFSDSEDENDSSKCFIMNKEKECHILDITKQDTLPINSANISSIVNNYVIDSSPSKSGKCDSILNINKALDSLENKNSVSVNAPNSLKSLPSDLENAQPLRLTTKEREIVDIMIKNSSSLLNHVSSSITENTAPTPIPVFKYSEEIPGKKETIGVEVEVNCTNNYETPSSRSIPSSAVMKDSVTSESEIEAIKEVKVNTINNFEDQEILSENVVENSNNLFTENIQEGLQITDFLSVETIPDNNNIQMNLPIKDIKLPHTPTRKRSRRLSGLNPEVIIDQETPVTPLRRSLRLNTPSKSLTTSGRKKTKELSDVEENDISAKIKSLGRSRRRRSSSSSSSISHASNDVESIEVDPALLTTPSRRRRTRSGASEPKEIPPIPMTPSLNINRQEDSNTSESETIIFNNSHETMEGNYTKIVAEDVETRLHGFVKEENENSRSKEYSNTPVKQVDTPRRRSARLSKIKDTLGTIVEDLVENRTPGKSTTDKSTPTKKLGTPTTISKKKSVSQSSPIVEPLETIKEDSEMSSKSFSLPYPEDDDEIPTTPLSSFSRPPASVRLQRQSSSDVVKQEKESEQKFLNQKTPADFSSLKNSKSNPPKSPSLSEILTFNDNETSIITTSENIKVPSIKDGAIVNSSNIPRESLDEEIFSDDQLSVTINKKSPKSSCIGETEAELEKDNLKESTEVTSHNNDYNFVSPEVNSKTISLLKSFAEKKSNATLPSSKHSRLSWRRSRTSLSMPKGFEFPMNESNEIISNIGRKGTIDSVSPVQSPHNFILNDDDVFLTNECKNREIVNEGSPAPIYHLFRGNEDVMILPKKASKPKTRISYHRGVTSLKSYNNDNIIGRETEDHNKACKKVRGSTFSCDLSEKKISNSILKKDVKDQLHLRGFLFQNPEIMSANEAVSEMFEKLTKEHERMVSENFVFSPPFSFSDNRRKKRRKLSRNSDK